MATAAKIRQHEKWASLFYHAQYAGREAGYGSKPEPMVVYSPKVPFFDESPDLSQPVYHVPDGPCGFAWVNLSAAKGPEGKEARQFINWLTGRTAPAGRGCEPSTYPEFRVFAERSYYGGRDVWVSGFDQSVQRKAAAARAVAKVLAEGVPGLRAWPMDRLD
jgi:hypothetical protein